MLAHTLSDFHQYVQKARKMSITSRSRSRKSNEEHQAILEAIREQDAGKAEELATQHIMNTIQNLEQFDELEIKEREDM